MMQPQTSSASNSATQTARALPGARAALVLLLAINLFNYIDRQVLAAVIRLSSRTSSTSPGFKRGRKFTSISEVMP